MKSIFNYHTFEANLCKKTRTLFVTFSNEQDNYLTMETLFELESLFAWCGGKIEINSIFIDSKSEYLSRGYNLNVLENYSAEKLKKFTEKLQKINQVIMLLPQTVIIDLKSGTENIASEFATACDIRIAKRSCNINFNHTKLGIIACSGGMAQLSQTVGHANAKNWLLSNSDIRLSKLESSGFIFQSYVGTERKEVIDQLLNDISSQSPIQRIQTKLGVVENVRHHIENMSIFEKQIAKAARVPEDWKLAEKSESMKAKNIKIAVKKAGPSLELIKTQVTSELPN